MSRMTTKGQVTIPREVRDKLGLRAGDEVEFIEAKGVVTIRRKVDLDALRAALAKWQGYLKDLNGRSSDELVEEMRGPRLEDVRFKDDEKAPDKKETATG